ncbi:hypothetical protein Gasu2_42750 [Galdieria sulphuraria]|uniref:Cytochrome B561-related protein n=1 Tax=Galdieria sulphuraria TaxID=130081 RepID=M2XQY3_GALSU|nr:cytochrome B561-related protein [Galdieria sulphuraria]EME32657.1 cytochrome B561-related protein [Galdieria sulphuraria]GJD10056.1 hypothetical protein Gasu2_42750 [Galdieria sulphuraria]|eukprot:XP_005709177.1 cytochrome B561-related protein [Galdieria sulphuraria]
MSSTDLGWLTGSSVLPKKRHYINKVSGRSLFGLRAALYKEEEASKFRWKRRTRRRKWDETKNPGVEQRAAKDINAMAVDVTNSLEKKAALYEQLCEAGVDEESEYMVDFQHKSLFDEQANTLENVSDGMVGWTANLRDNSQHLDSLAEVENDKKELWNMETYRKLGEEEWKQLVNRALWWKKHGFLFGGIPKDQIDTLYYVCWRTS